MNIEEIKAIAQDVTHYGSNTQLNEALGEVNSNLTKISAAQLNMMLAAFADELEKRLQKQIEEKGIKRGDTSAEIAWEKCIKHLPPFQKERFILLLVKKVFG